MHYFSTLFGKELYMFHTDLMSIIRSLNTVFTAIGICHTSYGASEVTFANRWQYNYVILVMVLVRSRSLTDGNITMSY
jgi:hypothetical protein